MSNISRVLIANRGEIALRIIRTCNALRIGSVLVVSETDKDTLPARMADRTICIGPPRPAHSYLRVENIVHAALATGASAVHPGYGFLAEQPELAEACEKHGLIFIGPRPDSIRRMGDKVLARNMVKQLGIPVIPGSLEVRTLREAADIAEGIGFPVLLKAPKGGGGRGIKRVMDAAELRVAFETALAEVRAAFADETLYIERYVPDARHIEVQVLGDRRGNVIHLGERDCSIQRRYQKIVEESPAPSISTELREDICKAGTAIARNMGYESAGTVEFLLDQDSGRFYFMEMNTRIQVEHPVTEMVSGVDLVCEQIRIAGDQTLSLSQSDVKLSGHAIECRINAESPSEEFRPCPGRITQWVPPQGPRIRVDSHCYSGYVVPPYYDSLLAKVVTGGASRNEAIERMQAALGSFVVTGVDTTIPFLQFLISRSDYKEGRVNTRWVEKVLMEMPPIGSHT